MSGDLVKGIVHEAGGGVYRVLTEAGDPVEASLRGRLKQQARTGGRVVVGDSVTVEPAGESWVVASVDERRNELVRRGRGGRIAKVLAANIDQAFVVVAAKRPDVTPELVDRLLALAESSRVRPLVVVNKVDLEGAGEVAETLRAVYEPIGYRVLLTSAEAAIGMDALFEAMCSGTSTLIGPSGVGKSSLLNTIDPALDLETGVLSRKTGTGRHTTVGSRLLRLSCGGLIADTPGFGDVGLWSVSPTEIGDCFPEIASASEECRFRGCAHLEEPDCAVKVAVEEGGIAATRYASYTKLRQEALEASAR